MNTRHHHHHHDSLSPEKLQMFIAGLSGLNQEEVRKAKVLYIRNAISEYKALKASFQAFGCMQAMFFIIPIFWPVLFMQKKMMRTGETLFRERLENALDVWRDDLGGEHFDLDEI